MVRSEAEIAEDGDGRKITANSAKETRGKLKEFIPPDGGYGWVIVIAVGVTNFALIPLIQNFGLLYKDSMERWNISTTEYTFILNLQMSICNCVGLIMGPLLKTYGYRRVIFLGAVLVNTSAVMTSQVNKFYLFLLTYSILGGVGVGLVWISTSVTINTYFKERRGVAAGISWAATGLSPVLFPHLLTWLRTMYDVHGTVLITSGIMMHSIPAALLLHPVEWHAKFKVIDEEKTDAASSVEGADESKNLVDSQGREDEDEAGDSIGKLEVYGSRDLHHRRKRHSLPHAAHGSGDIYVDAQDTLGLDIAAPLSLHSSRLSLDNAGGTNLRRTAAHSDFVEALEEAKNELTIENGVLREEKTTRRERFARRFRLYMRRVAEYFDLYLLCDFKFLMIFIGMTLAYGGEINFSLLSSFVFMDYGFPLEKVAILMSSLASVDLVTRFTMPFFTDHFKLDSLAMYSIGLIILGTGRIMLAHLSGYTTILFVALWLGFGKGLRTIYMTLIMPSIVPLDKLASASGLQTLANGIFFIAFGPLFGYIRDNSDSYALAIHAINFFTFGALVVWLLEFLVTRRRKRIEEKDKNKKDNKTKYVNELSKGK